MGDVQEERGLSDVEEDRECRRLLTQLFSCLFNSSVMCLPQEFFHKSLSYIGFTKVFS